MSRISFFSVQVPMCQVNVKALAMLFQAANSIQLPIYKHGV